ncbi:DDE-type integrase/transposase/recombinase [Alloiococcus sp. CFN-8]|uniref:DDE-type integrase/transposase/recombinase n=1 Tax=Alloiococcus sp. CFN-8 TaxID=3416081 RepID=UPI003CED2667
MATDVTEFKWFESTIDHKVYLSAILDIYDRRIVSFIIRNSNDNQLVFSTLDAGIEANQEAHPIFHSYRGYQYTNRTFHDKLENIGMTQSMCRISKCNDNGSGEGFCRTLN